MVFSKYWNMPRTLWALGRTPCCFFRERSHVFYYIVDNNNNNNDNNEERAAGLSSGRCPCCQKKWKWFECFKNILWSWVLAIRVPWWFDPYNSDDIYKIHLYRDKNIIWLHLPTLISKTLFISWMAFGYKIFNFFNFYKIFYPPNSFNKALKVNVSRFADPWNANPRP